MNQIIANIFGIAAVILFILSYQIKKRTPLILVNASSRVFYVLQYVLLGALEGAVLDIIALVVSVATQRVSGDFLKKHRWIPVALSCMIIIAAGLVVYEDIFSLLPIAGVLFETGALWLKKEKHIRLVSLLGAPCWLAYNLVKGAYGSGIGNVLTIVSIGLAMIRYDILKTKQEP